MPKERIGIMGGSFNPIHERHVEIALYALRELKLDRMIFMPTGNPPHKHDELCEAEHRYEMTRLAISGLAHCETSRLEIDRKGTIYTLDTLTRLHKQMLDAEFFYLIGEDTLYDLPHWYYPDKVFPLCEFLVCRRENAEPNQAEVCKALTARGAKITFLSLPPKDVSATAIRAALSREEEPTQLSAQVMEYIRLMGLYGVKQDPPGADQWYPRLREALSEKRLLHSLLVSATARRLARIHGVNETQAATAALLHDCAKCMPRADMQRAAKRYRLLVDNEIMQNGNLLHGPVGAAIAQDEYGVDDPNVLSAIRCHTMGKVGMMPLDMVVFLADKIEPSRKNYPMLDTLRELSERSLTAATRLSLQSSLEYVEKQKNAPHPLTRMAADWLERHDKSNIELTLINQRSNGND